MPWPLPCLTSSSPLALSSHHPVKTRAGPRGPGARCLGSLAGIVLWWGRWTPTPSPEARV